MGRATINGGGSDGRYSISLDYGTDEIAGFVAKIDARLTEIETTISNKESELTAAEAQEASLISALNSKIAAYAAAPVDENSDERDAVDEATQELFEHQAGMQPLRTFIEGIKVEKSNLEKKKRDLNALPLTEARIAWCVDYTEDATGEVGTIELNGEQPEILIQPGGRAPQINDGELKHRLAMSPSATFLNAALLPGWQKFKPTYRAGTILAISDDGLCSIELDAAESSAQELNINQAETLADVPVEYMSCDAGAFEVGDYVVIKFEGQDWANPKVIGFVRNPRPCGPLYLWIPILNYLYSGGGGMQRYIDSERPDPVEGIWIGGWATGDYSTLPFEGAEPTNKDFTGTYWTSEVVEFVLKDPPPALSSESPYEPSPPPFEQGQAPIYGGEQMRIMWEEPWIYLSDELGDYFRHAFANDYPEPAGGLVSIDMTNEFIDYNEDPGKYVGLRRDYLDFDHYTGVFATATNPDPRTFGLTHRHYFAGSQNYENYLFNKSASVRDAATALFRNHVSAVPLTLEIEYEGATIEYSLVGLADGQEKPFVVYFGWDEADDGWLPPGLPGLLYRLKNSADDTFDLPVGGVPYDP